MPGLRRPALHPLLQYIHNPALQIDGIGRPYNKVSRTTMQNVIPVRPAPDAVLEGAPVSTSTLGFVAGLAALA